MVVQLYIEDFNLKGNFSPLDLFDDESLNMEFKLKDMADLAKVYSTYSRQFTVPASANNSKALNYYFDSSLRRSGSRYINCKIYINSQLFRVGHITVQEGQYNRQKLSNYKINFTTGLVSLKDRVGNDELKDLDYSDVKLKWSPQAVKEAVEYGFDRKVVIPLVSRSNVWAFQGDENNVTTSGKSVITLDEIRPALSVRYIMEKIIDKYKLNLNFPLIEKREFGDLYLWANNKTDMDVEEASLPLTKAFFTPVDSTNPTAYYTARMNNDNSFTVNFTGAHTDASRPYNIIVTLGGVVDPYSNKPYEGRFRVRVEDNFGNSYFGETDDKYNSSERFVKVLFPVGRKGDVTFKVYITTDVPLKYERAAIAVRLYRPNNNGFFNTYSSNNPPLEVISDFNFKYTIGNIKIIDFLSSIFKMYNVKVVEGVDSDKLNIYTDYDYIPKLIDITDYVDVESYNKKSTTIYKELVFTHKESNFFRNVEYKKLVGKEYGSEVFKSPDSFLSEDYKVETKFDILNWFNPNGTNIITSYGFSEVGNPVQKSDTIVLMAISSYDGIGDAEGNQSGVCIGTRSNVAIRYVAMSNITSGNYSITFDKDISPITGKPVNDSLYHRYFSNFIDRVYDPNTRLLTMDVNLPPEVIMNFNILDDVIFKDEVYSVEEASMDITTGKTKIVLMNNTSNLTPIIK